MEHVAIDLGGRESQICIRDEKGTIVEECRHFTEGLGKYLSKRESSRVILETCAEAFQIADEALTQGHQVRVVPATLVRALGVGARGIKTDTRDARVLSEVSCRIELPSVHIPSKQARELKSLCGMRDALVTSRTKLINTVRGWLRTQTIRLRSGAANTLTKRVRNRIVQLPSYVERQLVAIDSLTEQIAAADKEVKQIASSNEVCVRLMTVPGVGPVTAVSFIAAIDRVDRFANAHALESYLGLTPGEYSSSDRKRRTGITKAGSSHLRWTLIQAAWSARRCRGAGMDPICLWATKVEQRRGKKTAIVAMARKMAGVMYAMFRDGTTYDPLRALPMS